MTLVVGLTGRIGSGKTVVSDYLREEYNANQHRISQIFMDILDRLYLEHKREYLQELGIFTRDTFGNNVIVNAFRKDLEKADSDILIIDGIRYQNEVDLVRGFDNNLLLFIDASAELRYERCKVRGEKGEAEITYEDFLEAESKGTESYLDDFKKSADYTINNNGTLDELFEKIDELIEIRKA